MSRVSVAAGSRLLRLFEGGDDRLRVALGIDRGARLQLDVRLELYPRSVGLSYGGECGTPVKGERGSELCAVPLVLRFVALRLESVESLERSGELPGGKLGLRFLKELGGPS